MLLRVCTQYTYTCAHSVIDKDLFMMQRLQEKEGTLESVCGEMQEKKAHYERRIGELSGRHNDANNRIKLLEVHVQMYIHVYV